MPASPSPARLGCRYSAMRDLKVAIAAGVLIFGAAGGACKLVLDWLKSEAGQKKMRESYGVVFLRFQSFAKQLKEPNQIGCGAFGTVYRCLIPELGNRSYFAAKVLDRDKQKQLAQEECLGSREFFRELEILALCRHPNIVRIVAVSVDTLNLVIFILMFPAEIWRTD